MLLDGKRVGVTPLTLTELVARPGARVTLEHADFVAASGTVDLVAGEARKFERTLKAVPPVLGTIQLQVENGWGWIYLGRKALGRAPNEALQLPVGHHRLKIENTTGGLETWIEVNVSPPPKVNFYSARFPS